MSYFKKQKRSSLTFIEIIIFALIVITLIAIPFQFAQRVKDNELRAECIEAATNQFQLNKCETLYPQIQEVFVY